jgi:hypothetical protein
MKSDDEERINGHAVRHYVGALPPLLLVKLLRDTVGSLRRFPTRYEGAAWECGRSNRIFALQTFRSKRSETLWRDVADRCACHAGPDEE